jgi:DNA-directed RNA polymerase subunit H
MSTQNSTVINDIYTSRKQIVKYLKRLGYDTSQHEKFTIAEINAMKQASEDSAQVSQLNFEVSKTNEESVKCKVVYYLKPSMKKSLLQEMVSDYYDYNDDKKKNGAIIIITLSNINDTITNAVRELWERYQEYCVVFDISTLQYNILEHEYVPHHQKLTEVEKVEMFKRFNVLKDNQLPEISMFDPVAKAILLRPGEVCKITRYDKISYKNEFYRNCVI